MWNFESSFDSYSSFDDTDSSSDGTDIGCEYIKNQGHESSIEARVTCWEDLFKLKIDIWRGKYEGIDSREWGRQIRKARSDLRWKKAKRDSRSR